YRNNRKVGSWIERDRDGDKVTEGEYASGLEHGVWTRYGKGERVLGTYEMKRGNGVKKTWYDTGELHSKTGVRAGLAHGVHRRMHKSGKVAVRGRFEDGFRHGAWTEWHESGKKRLDARYERGALVGTWRRYHENGRLAEEASY